MPESPLKILIVEDEAVVLHTLELILKQHGYSVRGVRYGAGALALAESFLPDILLCDINLPDIDGIQVAIQAQNILPSLRVVLLSGEITSADLLDSAKRDGHLFEVLAKPTEPRQLLAILERKPATSRDPVGIHRVK
jgi:CheY-like chemotaxis protein